MKNAVLSLSLFGVLAAASAAQDTIHVPADQPTISAGIAAASNGDTVLVAPGTYHESNIQFAGKIIAVRSTHGPAQTIVDADYNNRCFRFNGGETPDTLLEGFTLREGQAPTAGGTVGDGGGGILIISGSPTIRSCWFQSCRADNGSSGSSGTGYRGGHAGALYIATGSPLIESCRFEGNSAGTGGPGATGSTGGSGNLFSPPDPGGTGRTGGRGGHGGAVFLDVGSPSFVNCFFRNNQAGRGGQGGRGGRGGNAGSWVGSGANGGRGGTGGTGGNGGAIFVNVGSPLLVNCTVITHGLGSGGSGGAGGSGGSSSLGNGSNGANGSTGALGAWAGLYTTSGAVRNTILWANVGAELPLNNTVSYSCVEGGYNGPGNINVDPELSGYDLLANSPCIDAGDNGQVPAGLSVDMNGEPRFVDERLTADVGVGLGAVVDIGADEFATDYVFPYGCGNPAGSLAVSGGSPAIGGSITLNVSRSDLPRMNGDFVPVPQAMRAGVIVAMAGFDSGCGLAFPGGFLQVDVSQGAELFWSDQPFTGDAVDVTVDIPADPMLIGTSLYAQGIFTRLRGAAGEGVRLTESLELVVGP